MKILLLDDEPSILEQAKIFLVLEQAKIFLEREEDALDIDTVSSPEDALELLEDESYDCVVSDYKMPEMDGLEFLRVVRDEMERDIPIIMFTGRGREEVAMEALNLGADRYLQKGGDSRTQYGVLARAIVEEVNVARAEGRLKGSEKRYRELAEEFELILDHIPALVFYKDTEGNLIRVNESFAEPHGMSKEELEGKSTFDLYPEEEARKHWQDDKEVIESGEPKLSIVETWSPEEERIVRTSKIPYILNGEVKRVIGFSEDITERKEAEEELARSREEYKSLLDGMNDTVWVILMEIFLR